MTDFYKMDFMKGTVILAKVDEMCNIGQVLLLKICPSFTVSLLS